MPATELNFIRSNIGVNMKKIALALGCLISLFHLVFVQTTFAQKNRAIADDEYAVYSAFINQVYLSDIILDWFSIRGTKSYPGKMMKVEQVVIYPHTMPEPSLGGNFAFINAPFKSEIPGNLFASLLTQNKKSYKVANKFKVDVEHQLFRQTLEEAQAYSAEAQKRKVSYDVLFLEKFPKAGGTIMFYRAGFDRLRKNALVGVLQTNIQNPKYLMNRRGGYVFAFLTKTNRGWVVKKVFPETLDIQVDLNKCEPITKHTDLPLGSMSFSVVGKDAGSCRISESFEIEMGGTTTECLVPSSLGKITITPGSLLENGVPFYYSRNVSRFCEKPKSNSIFGM